MGWTLDTTYPLDNSLIAHQQRPLRYSSISMQHNSSEDTSYFVLLYDFHRKVVLATNEILRIAVQY